MHDAHKDEPIVKSLKIDGAKQVSVGDIKSRILTEETSWFAWIPFFFQKHHFDLNVWRTDLRRVERFYRSQGFYQARVLEDTIEPIGDKAVRVRMAVNEGSPTIVSKLELTGLDELSKVQRREIEREVRLRKGDVFVEDKWQGLETHMRDSLHEFGYAEAKIKSEARVDLDLRRADVDVHAEPGQRYKFGSLRIRSHTGTRVADWRILEQAQEAINGEDWYSETAKNAAQARIFKLGVFGAAKVENGVPDPASARVPLEVDVQEAPFHVVRYGVGFGLEALRNDAHLIANYTHRDFLGSIRRLDLQARAGWAFLPTAYAVATGTGGATRSAPIARVSAELFQPRILRPNFAGTTRVELERALEPAYSFTGGKARVGIIWSPTLWFSVTPSYNIELYRLDIGSSVRLGSRTPALLYGCPQNCVLSYLEQTIQVDKRDDRQDPRKGYLLSFSIQEGGGILGGSFKYLRVLPEARGYVSFLDQNRLTFSARVKVGTLIPLAGEDLSSPIVARFYSGGDDMRGFGIRRLAPMNLVKLPKDGPVFNTQPEPIGGNGLFEAQLETRYVLVGNLVGAVFFDTGFVTTPAFRFSDIKYITHNLLAAVGFGVRYRTPIGPLRLDFAYRPSIGPPLLVYLPEGLLDPGVRAAYPMSQGCFGIGRGTEGKGGAPEDPCNIHLSIGEAF